MLTRVCLVTIYGGSLVAAFASTVLSRSGDASTLKGTSDWYAQRSFQRTPGFLTSLLTAEASGGSASLIHAAPKSPTCQELCEKASQKDAYRRECVAHCRVRTDITGGERGREALRRFALEHSPRTRKAYEEYDPSVKACEPKVHPDHLVVDIKQVDSNSDGVVTQEEILSFAHDLCVPDEMELEIFARSDVNQDGLLDEQEWRTAGEETVLEYEIERFIGEANAPGASELPSFDKLDKNSDGVLEDYEVFDGFYAELESHFTGECDAERDHIEEAFWDHADEIMPSMDLDGDGVVSREEYASTHGREDGRDSQEQEIMSEDAVQAEAPSPATATVEPSEVTDLAVRAELPEDVEADPELKDINAAIDKFADETSIKDPSVAKKLDDESSLHAHVGRLSPNFKLRGVAKSEMQDTSQSAEAADWHKWRSKVEEAWENVVASDQEIAAEVAVHPKLVAFNDA